MLIFMLNSQLLSVSGDSKNTHTYTAKEEEERKMKLRKMGNIFGLWFIVMLLDVSRRWRGEADLEA